MEKSKVQERQPMLIVTCGETGVGKTYRNLLEISRYMKGDASTNQKGRKVLAFDVNDDDYPQFKTVSLKAIHKLKTANVRRVRPITASGKTMSLTEKRDVVELMVNRFKDGLLVLEDLDKYMAGAKGQSIIGLLTTNRHNGLDIMISHQSIAKITTTEWQNCTLLRIHKQVDDPSRYRERIPNYFLVCIASYIVNEQYELANDLYSRGEIPEKEYKIRRSFCAYVDMRKLRIQGVSRAAFIRASKKYIDTHDTKRVKMALAELNFDDTPKFKNRKEVIIHFIRQYLRHHEVTIPASV